MDKVYCVYIESKEYGQVKVQGFSTVGRALDLYRDEHLRLRSSATHKPLVMIEYWDGGTLDHVEELKDYNA